LAAAEGFDLGAAGASAGSEPCEPNIRLSTPPDCESPVLFVALSFDENRPPNRLLGAAEAT
jgi:hypothetical protein